jgi:hypothetical protein
VLSYGSDSAPSLEIELDRKKESLSVRRVAPGNFRFWCQGEPSRHGNELKWVNRTKLLIRKGELVDWSPQGYTTELSVGNGLLPLKDPLKGSYPFASVAPDARREIIIELR